MQRHDHSLPSRFQVDGSDAHGNLVAGNEGTGRLSPCSKRFRLVALAWRFAPTLINGRVYEIPGVGLALASALVVQRCRSNGFPFGTRVFGLDRARARS